MVEQMDLGIVLGLAYQAFVDRLRADLARQGFDDLGGAYGYVFRALAEQPLSQREMVARRYVRRRPDPTDSRVKRLSLDQRGRAALAAARRFHAAFERALGKDVGAPAVRRLRQILDRIAHHAGDREAAGARLRPL
jgi:hypothetical protein